nr:hypothetical protein [Chloroflexia bacterium]
MKRSMPRVLQSTHSRREVSRQAAALSLSLPVLGGLAGLGYTGAYAQDGGAVNLASNASDPA